MLFGTDGMAQKVHYGSLLIALHGSDSAKFSPNDSLFILQQGEQIKAINIELEAAIHSQTALSSDVLRYSLEVGSYTIVFKTAHFPNIILEGVAIHKDKILFLDPDIKRWLSVANILSVGDMVFIQYKDIKPGIAKDDCTDTLR
jgi:hypothetical protein